MRSYKPFHPLYVGSNIKNNSIHPEDFFTTAAGGTAKTGITPLFSFKGNEIIRPVFKTGRYAHGDFDDPLEDLEPEQGTEAHPYMNPQAMKHWGCHSRNWYGYNQGSWNHLKQQFYTQYHPEVQQRWDQYLGHEGRPAPEDFVAEHGETQKAWNEWSKASLAWQRGRESKQKALEAEGKPIDERQTFRNALLNVSSLYKDALASDGRNFPGRDAHSALKKYFEANPHLRSPNVEWATQHLENLKNGIEDLQSGGFHKAHEDISNRLGKLGFTEHFAGRGQNEINSTTGNINIPKTSATSFFWSPDRQEPYGIHIEHEYHPYNIDPDRKHLLRVHLFTGSKRSSMILPAAHIETHLPDLMKTVSSKTGKSGLVHNDLIKALGLENNSESDWGFRASKQPIVMGSNVEDFASKFLSGKNVR